MKNKKNLYCEIAYILGLISLAFGVAFMAKADFGLSMLAAPVYLIHLRVSSYYPFYSFGMSEYVFEAFLLVLLSVLIRKFKITFLISFALVFLYGHVLDLMISVVNTIPFDGIPWRLGYFFLGLFLCALGVAFIFHTYLPPAAHEMFVKEFSGHYHLDIGKVKTVYDCTLCLLAVILSFSFYGFGKFVGISWGTVLTALVNGWLIGRISSWLENHFTFVQAFVPCI